MDNKYPREAEQANRKSFEKPGFSPKVIGKKMLISKKRKKKNISTCQLLKVNQRLV